MNMTNMNNPKPWAEGHPSLYEGHDITHRPDWANIIVWDAFFNNLTAGFMVLTGIAWFAGPPLLRHFCLCPDAGPSHRHC